MVRSFYGCVVGVLLVALVLWCQQAAGPLWRVFCNVLPLPSISIRGCCTVFGQGAVLPLFLGYRSFWECFHFFVSNVPIREWSYLFLRNVSVGK